MDDTAQNNNPNITLTPDDLKKLTTQLSSEIDEEIKNQLSVHNQPTQKPAEMHQAAPDLAQPTAKIETNDTKDSTDTKGDDEKPLTKDQIDFFNKIHSDPKLWSAFTSLSKDNLAKVLDLYEKGQLSDLGIAADPLVDKLKNTDLGKEVLIKPGDNFNSLLTNAGHNLSFSSKDSLTLGLHVLANEKLIKETRSKAESAGLTIEKLPEPNELIDLIKTGLTGNNTSYSQLVQFLNLLPTNSKFRVLDTDEIQGLEKYFSK